DRLGRPIKQETSAGGQRTRSRKYKWGMNDRLQEIFDDQQGRFLFEHDSFGNLAAATYPDGSRELRMPDAVGNLFRRSDQGDREYGPAGQLLKAEGTVFEYDPEGNMIAKIRPDGSNWRYEWNAAGMLARVIRPDGKIVYFTYDALGRRIAKRYGQDLIRWVWDGNLILHEWREEAPPAPLRTVKASNTEPEGASGKMVIRRRTEKVINEARIDLAETDPSLPDKSSITTWLFEPETFAPLAKLTPNQDYGIVTDHLGTPVGMYNESGEQVWSLDLSIYGNVRKLDGWRGECPVRYPGQYEDVETGLYYNRFRYYDPEVGGYVSQDPIGLSGGVLSIYSYVNDCNLYFDPLGLIKENSVYVLKDGDKIVYVGIGNADERFRFHKKDKKGKFDRMEVIAETDNRRAARNIEGSMLHHMGNKKSAMHNDGLLNAVRKDGGYWHSYSKNPISPRKLLSEKELGEILGKDPVRTKKVCK
ncbi:MAG: RHS repeat-associated core domain-containing protein, partial [Bacteroidota bacterium]